MKILYTETILGVEVNKIPHDLKGNPRYLIEHSNFLNDSERAKIRNEYKEDFFTKEYELAVKKSKQKGGSKYRGKSYYGGIVFSSFNLHQTIQDIKKISES